MKNLAQKKAKMDVFRFEYVRSYFLYKSVGALDKQSNKTIVEAIKALDSRSVRSILAEKFGKFKMKMIAKATEGEVGAAYIADQVGRQLNDFCKQISLFEDWE